MLTLEDIGVEYYKITSSDFIEVNPIILDALSAIEEKRPTPTREQWDSFWAKHDGPQEPQYLNRQGIFRYRGGWIEAPQDTEAKFAHELRARLYCKYLADVDSLAEFGCGSGANLRQYAEMYPTKRLFGYDWSEYALRRVRKIPQISRARCFDMRCPPETGVPPQLGVLTHGAMEQLGDDFQPFIDFLCRIKPKVVVHVEPCVEIYDEDTLFDKLAAMYHRSRGYLGKFIVAIERVGTVIEKVRTGFGNYLNEGYSVVVWSPT